MIPLFYLVSTHGGGGNLCWPSEKGAPSTRPRWPYFNYKNITFYLLVNLFPRVLRLSEKLAHKISPQQVLNGRLG